MADSDKDGLTDVFERRIGTDPFDKDTDNDGLTDKAERTLGTDPKNYDSDGDGYMDGSEFAQGRSPTHADPPNPYADRYGRRDTPFRATPDDPDADGLDEMQERMLKTNPNDPDTDGDGIGDGMESIGHQGRSPTKAEPIVSPKTGPQSSAISTDDDTLVASDDPEPAFEPAPVESYEQPQVAVASFDSVPDDAVAYADTYADTDTYVEDDMYVEDDAYVTEEMSSDV